MRVLYAVVVVVAVAATSCKGRNERQVGTLPPPPSLPQVDGGLVGVPSVGAPRGLASANRAFERLAPDRRFVLAFDQVDRIFDTASTTHAVARSNADGTWSIETTDKSGVTSPITQLPDRADFEPLMDAVAAYAARRAAPATTPKSAEPRSLPAEPVDIPTGHNAFAALAIADVAWKKPSERPLAARRATIALVGLVFGTYDRLDLVDELPARAIATAAVARALGAAAPASVEALLARVLLYGAAALRLAPETAPDAAAAYATLDNARLSKLARSSMFAKLAWLRRLGVRGDEPGQRAWIEHELARERLTLPLLTMQSIGAAQLESHAALASQFPPVALAEAMDASIDLARESGPAHDRVVAALSGKTGSGEAALAALGTSRSTVLLAYDKAVTALPRREGPFRDSGLERDYLDANMCAAMAAIVLHAEARGAPAESVALANELAEPNAPRTKAFRTFFAASVAGLSTARPLDVAAQAIAPSALGVSARTRILRNVAWRLSSTDAPKVGRGFLARLDSRPFARGTAAWVNDDLIKNPRASDAFYRSAAATSGGAQAAVEIRVLSRDRDADKILRFARWPGNLARERARLVAWAIREKIGDRADLDRIADDLLREQPLDWSVHETIVNAYFDSDPARSRTIVQSWLDRKAGAANGGLGDVGARIALARMLRRDHKLEEAIEVLRPAAATWQGGALGELSIAQAEARHPAEAEKLGSRRLERYPQSIEAVADLARVRWINNDMVGAAAVLASPPSPVNDAQMYSYVAPVFVELFFDKPEQAAAAGEALRAAKLATAADLCGQALVFKKAYAVALLVLQPKATPHLFIGDTPPERSHDSGRSRELTFEAIRGAKGKEDASKWLRGEVGKSRGEFYPVVYEAYRRDTLEAVLDVNPPISRTPEDIASEWTMRLASQLRRDGRITSGDEARKALGNAPNARYTAYARYLLGDIDADTVEKLASSTKTTCELAYYMAVRAIGDGRHTDAMDLLRVAADTASTSDGEFDFANDDLDTYRAVTHAFASLPPGLPRTFRETTEGAK